MSREFEDMDVVKVEMGPTVQMVFIRMLHTGTKTPHLVHGRLAFQSSKKAFINLEDGRIDFNKKPNAEEEKDMKDMFLYWDG